MSAIRYLIYQHELAPTTGHEHLQGYAELFKPMGPIGFIKALGLEKGDVWVGKRKGTAQQARDYCLKDEAKSRKPGTVPIEFGTWEKSPGKRTDLEAACQTAKQHGLKRVAEEHPVEFVKYARGLGTYIDILQKKRKFGDPVEVHVRWGLTGCGKTHYVHEKYGDQVYCKDPTNKWWDGYCGQKVVLIDDFDGKIEYRSFLTWMDKYPVRVEKKGGSVDLNATIFFITSNTEIKYWWPNEGYLDPFFRRVTSITHLTEAYKPPKIHDELMIPEVPCAICAGGVCTGLCVD